LSTYAAAGVSAGRRSASTVVAPNHEEWDRAPRAWRGTKSYGEMLREIDRLVDRGARVLEVGKSVRAHACPLVPRTRSPASTRAPELATASRAASGVEDGVDG